MLALAYGDLFQIIPMLFLAACSAFFSGSETAFFNLSRRQIKQLKDSSHKIQHLVVNLLSRRGQLLNCLLFGNMIVNVLYFAVSSVFIIKLKEHSSIAAVFVAFLSFILLVLFGEILPKSLAYTNSLAFSKIAALPAYLLLKAFTPLQILIKVLILEPVLRLFLGPKRSLKAIGVQEFRSLIYASRKQGLITADEKNLLGEVVDLGLLKVRHVVRPRVDMVAYDITGSPQEARDVMIKNHLTKIPVYSQVIDDIIGVVHLRQMLLEPEMPLDKCVHPIHFVPEQKTVVSLLEFFRQTESDIAVVVDEHGGIVGSVQLEDIAEELLGPVRHANELERIEQTGPFEYRLPGSLAVHDWTQAFGVDIGEMRVSTLGGLITELLGKVPKSGDVAYIDNLKFTVEKVRRHRIETLILNLQPRGVSE